MGASGRAVWGRCAFAVIVILCGACSSGAAKTTPPSTTASGAARPRATLDFRAVQYDGSLSPVIAAASDPSCTRRHGIPPGSPDEVLLDRKHEHCYLVGRVLLTGVGIDSASVGYDSTSSQWVVDLHFRNNDFVTKVATPYVNRQIVIVLNNVVQSSPTINPGITGRDIEVVSGYSRAQAIEAAASILGVAPSEVRVGSTDAAGG
jgi:preprotein translocase subunit SecD